MRALWIAALAAAACAGPAAAQPETVPMELVEQLFGRIVPGEAELEITVGRFPERFPRVALPPAARVLGGMMTAHEARAVATHPEAPEAAAREVQQALLASGWTSSDAQGQQSPSTDQRSTAARHVCRGDAALSIVGAPRQPSGSYVHIGYSPAAGLGCLPATPSPGGGDTLLPALHAPDGAQGMSGGSSSTGTPTTALTREVAFRCTQAPAALLAHYGAQLHAAGWTLFPAASGPGVAAQSLRTRTQDGKDWVGTLGAAVLPGTDLCQMTVYVARPDAQADRTPD